MITINATGDTTLHTAGKYCPEDILVKVPSGGSGSTSVETCTVTVTISSSNGAIIPGFSSVSYLDKDYKPVCYMLTTSTASIPTTHTITTLKNSLISIVVPSKTINNLSGTAILTNGECIVPDGVGGMALYADIVPVGIYGNCSIEIII